MLHQQFTVMQTRLSWSGNADLVYHACAPLFAVILCRMDVDEEQENDAKRGRLRAKTTPPASAQFSMSRSLDSGVGSFDETDLGEDKLSNSSGDGPAMSGEQQTPERTNGFRFIYLGNSVVDRRYTQSMLPWVIAEVRRKRERQAVHLNVELMTVKAINNISSESVSIVFQHKVQTITRCARSADKKCFAYLTKIPDEGFSCYCYVFEAVDSKSVSGFLSSIRNAAKQVAEQSDTSIDTSGDMTADNSNNTVSTKDENQETDIKMFPLWYVGRVGVSHRQAPPTLIDECVELFKNMTQRCDLERELNNQQFDRKAVSHNGPVAGKLGKTNVHFAAKKANSLDDGKMLQDRKSCKENSSNSMKNASSIKVENCNEFSGRPRSASDGDKRRDVYSSSKSTNPAQAHLHVKTHSRNASLSKVGENRNILFQISSQSVMCQSVTTKIILMERRLREVSFCQQGTKAPEHFGFICYESKTSQYMCYVFKGESEQLVDNVMQSLKQAFHSAWQATGPTSVCDMCPLHHLHQLCVHLEGCTVLQQHDILQRHRINLSDDEMSKFTEIFQAENPSSDINEENEVIMAILRGIYERRQQNHTHNLQGQQLQKDKAGPNLLQKARKSLSSSFGGFLNKRGRARTMRSDFVEEESTERGEVNKPSPAAKRNRSLTFDSSAGPNASSTPPMSPIKEKTNNEECQAVTTSTPEKPPLIGTSSPQEDTVGFSDTPPSTPSKTTNHHRRLSRTSSYGYRQAIFHSVVTPSKKDTNADPGLGTPQSRSWAEMVGRKRTSQELRALWRKAIMEQILLIRMEKENKSLQVNQNAAESKLLKLGYKEIPKCPPEAAEQWDRILELGSDQPVDRKILMEAVKAGVPKARRGEIWKFLAKQHDLHNPTREEQLWKQETYEEIKQGNSNHQHSIFIDLGRTFPSHPYFSTQLGHGQLCLFNILKAYSVLDEEVGYCQGLSFVAGILLMHMGEKDAFDLLRFMLFALNVRRQYKPDMQELQTQFYMLSRLLHDYYKPVSECLQELDITPTLYAAPWFLTLFASHFPVGFVARVMDMMFVQGMEVVFKVMLLLLGSCQEELLCSDGLEGAVEVMKTSLPPFAAQNVEKLVSEVLSLDVSKDLESYEVEYCVLKEEDLSVASFEEIESEKVDILEAENAVMTRQIQDLTEQLSSAKSTNRSLEATISTMQMNQTELLALIRSLRAENESLKKNFEKLKNHVFNNDASGCGLGRSDVSNCKTTTEASFTEENTDSFEHIGSSNELTDDETESLSRDSPADELVEETTLSSSANPPLSGKCEDMAVSR